MMTERVEVWLFSVQKTFIVSVTNGLRGSVKFLQFMLQGFNSISRHRLCDSRSHALASFFFLFFFLFTNSSAGMRVCSYPTLLQSASLHREHISPFKGLSDRMRPQLALIVDIERVHLSGTLSRYNHNVNLLMQLAACRADFTFPFGATPHPAGSRLALVFFSNGARIWTLASVLLQEMLRRPITPSRRIASCRNTSTVPCGND